MRIKPRSPSCAIKGREIEGMRDFSSRRFLTLAINTARNVRSAQYVRDGARGALGHRIVERRSGHKTMLVGTRWARVGILVCLSIFWSPVFSEIDRSAYRYSTIGEMVAKHGLKVGSSEITEKDTVLLPPEYKYRLRLTVTGRIRELPPDTIAALSVWSQTHPDLPAFLKEYTQEVETAVDDKPVWLIWQRSLVAPFRAERSSGGDIDVYAILAGAFHGKLLLVVTAFESLR